MTNPSALIVLRLASLTFERGQIRAKVYLTQKPLTFCYRLADTSKNESNKIFICRSMFFSPSMCKHSVRSYFWLMDEAIYLYLNTGLIFEDWPSRTFFSFWQQETHACAVGDSFYNYSISVDYFYSYYVILTFLFKSYC